MRDPVESGRVGDATLRRRMRREVRFFGSVTRENNDATTILAIKSGKTVRHPSWGDGREGQSEGRMVVVAAVVTAKLFRRW